MNKSVTLQSGAKLEITLSPFAESEALFEAIMAEAKGIQINGSTELGAAVKDLFCIGFSSPKIKAALKKCMERTTYNGLRIDKDTFEPTEAREDYLSVCFEVAKEHILPFSKALMQQYYLILGMLTKSQA